MRLSRTYPAHQAHQADQSGALARRAMPECLARLYARRNGPREAAMTTGLILLGFLAILVAFFLTRMRRRLGLGVTGGTWAVIIAVFAIIVLSLWASSQH